MVAACAVSSRWKVVAFTTFVTRHPCSPSRSTSAGDAATPSRPTTSPTYTQREAGGTDQDTAGERGGI